jgi:Tol biopolymer transport system component
MPGTERRLRAVCRVAVVLLCAPFAAGLVATSAPAVPTAALGVVPAVVGPRTAFTDARDETLLFTQPGALALSPLAPPAATHVGENSVNARGVRAQVSTADDPHGDVYLTGLPGQGSTSVRVTCGNAAVESHPVVSPDGTRVAYASNASGVFRIWIATLEAGTVPRCETTRHDEVRGAPGGENLWPAWVGNDHVVFSGTGLDRLGDIWEVEVGTALDTILDAPAQRLTDGAAAETQPSFGVVEGGYGPSVVIFTTTEFRPDGSLGYLVLPGSDSGTPPPTPPSPPFQVHSLWGNGSSPQSSEGVWSSDGLGVAYTTRERDPYGDVVVSVVNQWGADTVVLQSFDLAISVAGVPGSAESHGAWLADDNGRPITMLYTHRSGTGDISDVFADDGSGRRTIADTSVGGNRLDESTPTYSPDGSHIAYSRTSPTSPGRELVMADSDGQNLIALDSTRPSGALDVEPAWSPDGARIAFVRFPACHCTSRPSEIWVADVTTRQASQLPRLLPENTVYWDENPSWSPDGARLVVARATEILHPELTVALSGPDTVRLGESVSVQATVTNHGPGSAQGSRLVVTPPSIEGTPALSLVTTTSGCNAGDGLALTCPLAPIPAGASRTITFQVEGASTGPQSLNAGVSVTGVPTESDTSNNTDTRTITVTTPPDVVVTANPTTFSNLLSQPRSLVFTVRNNGSEPAESVVLNVSWVGSGGDPGVMTLRPSTATTECPQAAAPLSCSLGVLTSGGSREVSVVISGVEPYGVTVRAEVPRVAAEVETTNNVATVLGSVCCRLASAIPQALAVQADWPAARLGVAAVAPQSVRGISDTPPDGAQPTLWVLDSSTGVGHQLTGPGPRVCVCPRAIPGRGPAWSPDGLRIAYENRGAVALLHLADVHGDATALDPATNAPIIDMVTGFTNQAIGGPTGAPTASRQLISAAEDPAWSPDGTELAIAGQPAGQADQRGIYRIKPDGSGLRVVAQERGPETEPAWQPFADLGVTLVAAPPSIAVGAGATLTATVTNSGPARVPQVGVEVTVPAGLKIGTLPPACAVAAGVVTCDVGSMAKGGTSTMRIPVTGTVVGTSTVQARVGSTVPDAVASNNVALATVDVTLVPPRTDVSVTASIDHNPGYVGGVATVTIVVANSATGSPTDVHVTITHPADILALTGGVAPCFTGAACDVGLLGPGATRTFSTAAKFSAPGTGDLTAAVTSTVTDTNASNDHARIRLTVKQPVVQILQPIGNPGSISMAIGQDFPPGVRVTLSWTKGLNSRDAPVTVGPDGTIAPTQILIFRRDEIGPRDLVATPKDSGLFDPVKTTMLVTARTVTPPADFVSRN